MTDEAAVRVQPTFAYAVRGLTEFADEDQGTRAGLVVLMAAVRSLVNLSQRSASGEESGANA